MNQIRAIQALNKKEIEQGISPEASWHADYRDTAFIYFGGLPYELSEGDVITIFSQFGEPVFLKLVRDKETGKSKGFGWLKYEDQRSTDLAVDNLGGATIGGRMVRVDHARYKPRDDDDPEEGRVGWEDMLRKERAAKGLSGDLEEEDDEAEEEEERRPMLKEEKELALLIQNHDDDDPMKAFLVEEKKKEIEEALQRQKKKSDKHERKQKHRQHRSHHRSRRDESEEDGRDKRSRGEDDEDRKRRSRRDETPVMSDRRDDEKRRSRRDETPVMSP
ncbi:RNA-binding motif protein, X-linked 2 [Pleurostoma richardsiae]|uniref:RNA-binding motif protein, X-linked 2 n=1 Tax=Pleurostoma richardsiae TaxID=41990 RepID=A0AA38RYF3_9PEZI|nr:RNA-binding motif protein, X-linked 2 [Pleurostoma richardsiae]